MSAPELTPVDYAFHELLRRAIAGAVTEVPNSSPALLRLTEAELIEVRKRLLTLSNLHAAIRRGEQHPHPLLELDRLRGWFPQYLEQLFAPLASAVYPALEMCQVVNPIVRDAYTCPHRDSGGLVCEASGSPEWHDHSISEHTIEHALHGSGYSCEAIDAKLAERINEQKGAVR